MFATKHGSFGRLLSITLAGLLLAAIAGCAGEDGNPGGTGPPGNTGGTGGTGGTGASGTLPLVDASGISSVKFLTARVSSVTIPADGKPVISFTLIDENNVARKGLAPASARVVMVRLYPAANGKSSEWRAYTTAIATAGSTAIPPIPATATQLQATAEAMSAAGSTFVDCAAAPEPRAAGSVAANCPPLANSGGVYVYKMADVINAADPNDPTAPAYDPTLTHRLGIEFRVYRNAAVTSCAAGDTTCSEDSLYLSTSNAAYTWRPSDGATTGILTRDIGSNTACDACHDQLNFHGGARSDVQYCVTCHNPFTADPQTANSVDMKVMIHKIHSGVNLRDPAGYTIVGYGGVVYDFSEILFTQDRRNCQTCHRPGVVDAPNADNWKLVANKAACATCHDGDDAADPVDFYVDASGNIAGGHPTATDAECVTCHGQTATAAALDGGKWQIDQAHFDPEERVAAQYKYEVVKAAAITAAGAPGATACAAATKGCKVLPGEFPLLTVKVTKCPAGFSSTGTCTTTPTAVRISDPEFTNLMGTTAARLRGRVAWTTRNFTSPGLNAAGTAGHSTLGQPTEIVFAPAFITAATAASPIVFTASRHGLSTGRNVTFVSMPGGYAALNGNTYPVTVINSNTFSIAVDGTAFGAFTAGGAGFFPAATAGMPPQAGGIPVFDAAAGTYTKAASVPMPASAVGGSAEAFLEGRMIMPVSEQPSFAAANAEIPVKSSVGVPFNFTDTAATARRAIINTGRCNDCHLNIAFHGDNRNSNAELCATCHNPELARSATVAATAPYDQTFDFKRMIHRLHSIGFYWETAPFEDVGYPGKLNNCEGCHAANTYYPVDPAAVFSTSIAFGADNRTPADDTAISPNTSICSSCHDSGIAKTHMEQNGGNFAAAKNANGSSTTALETCQLCHGSGQTADVKKVHRIGEYRYN